MIEGNGRARARRRAARVALAAAATLLASCSNDAPRGDRLALADCRLPRLATAAQCATLDVPEDRGRPGGRTIGLHVAVLRANTLSPKPDPLLILAGGPGQAASSLAAFASRLVEVRRTRDIVLVDQRGTGRSAPLDCAAFEPGDDADEALDVDPLPKARACVAELAARGVDLAHYTTAAWIADLEAVREALGVAKWNLWGGSYGSRVALEYVRRHPGRVRSAILDGVAPPSMRISLDVWRTRERALEAVFAACRDAPACAASRADPAATLEALRASLGPAGREVVVAEPRTGVTQTVTLTFDALLAGLHPLTYVPELAGLIPAILARAADGDFAPLFATAQLVGSDLAEQVDVALHYAVTCAEDAPRVTAGERAALAALRAGRLARAALDVCDVWPRGDAADGHATPVASDLPILMLSGALDPVTPPAYAEEVGRTLANHRHVVAAGYGHIVSPHACGPRLVAAFVDRAGFDTLPSACIERFANAKRPPLWTGRLGPAP
ncbi:MAG: alpha/beta hydrolase [Betaproteobacteria bacterium]|nr:MAG: alpha/beta hydrolase [Betaproteobacteria bacterium]